MSLLEEESSQNGLDVDAWAEAVARQGLSRFTDEIANVGTAYCTNTRGVEAYLDDDVKTSDRPTKDVKKSRSKNTGNDNKRSVPDYSAYLDDERTDTNDKVTKETNKTTRKGQRRHRATMAIQVEDRRSTWLEVDLSVKRRRSSSIARWEGVLRLERLIPALDPICSHAERRRKGLEDSDTSHPIAVDVDDATCVSAISFQEPIPRNLYPTVSLYLQEGNCGAADLEEGLPKATLDNATNKNTVTQRRSLLGTSISEEFAMDPADLEEGFGETTSDDASGVRRGSLLSNWISEEFHTDQPSQAHADYARSQQRAPNPLRDSILSTASEPGAYAVGGVSTDFDCDTEPSDGNESQQPEEAEEQFDLSTPELGTHMDAGNPNDGFAPRTPFGTSSNGGLVVAKAVNDVDQDNLPHAQFAVETTKGLQVNSRSSKICGVSFTLLAFLALVVVMVVTPSKTESQESYLDPLSPSLSSNPSSAPTSSESYLLSLLPDYTLEAIQDPDSFQNRAYQWILKDLDYNPSLSGERIVQRFSLASLYLATEGDKWRRKENWLNHTVHECDWYNGKDFARKGLIERVGFPGYMSEFFPLSAPPPTRCDETSGLFQHLWLDQNNMNGPLPRELYLLTSLQTLSLGVYNNLQGPISSHIGQLTALEGLVIDNILGGGTIPTQIGLLTRLKGLGLSGNHHTGTIPSELEDLTNLQTLLLTGIENQLSGKVPDVRVFPNLKWLMLHGSNDLTGTIPTEIGLIESLELFTAGGNRLHGSIPSQIGLLSNMHMFSAYFNQFEGTLPTQLGLLTASTLLSVRGNLISGTIPSQIGQLTNLSVALSLHDNPFLTGTIPTEFGLLSNLYRLMFANNEHTGPVPSELGMLQSLGQVSFANNSLTGAIPETLASLHQSLYSFEADNNPLLSGTIPQALCNINGTCAKHTLRSACAGGSRLAFTCTDLLCGCNCPCTGSDSNSSLRY